MTAETVWLYGQEGSTYHDGSCKCERHCGNCLADLDQVRAQRDDMIARAVMGLNGPYTEADRLGPRERYCCDYCRGRAKRERALDRDLKAAGLDRMRSEGE